VYRIRNLLNEKVYVGASNYLPGRFSGHKSDLEKKMHSSYLLQADFDRYGFSPFVFQPLERVDKPNALGEREQWWINFFQAGDIKYGYNVLSDISGKGRTYRDSTFTEYV